MLTPDDLADQGLRSSSVVAEFGGQQVECVPVGGARLSGMVSTNSLGLAEVALLRLAGRPGFPRLTLRPTHLGYFLSWGEPLPDGFPLSVTTQEAAQVYRAMGMTGSAIDREVNGVFEVSDETHRVTLRLELAVSGMAESAVKNTMDYFAGHIKDGINDFRVADDDDEDDPVDIRMLSHSVELPSKRPL